MEEQINKLKSLIESSQKILITSHISPDPDAVSSVLLLGTTLKLNYPDKEIHMVIEEEPGGLDFLESYESISFKPIYEELVSVAPELLIVLDTNNYDRVSRTNGIKIREYIAEKNVKTVVIDHHEISGSDLVDLFINQESPATAQDVYEVLFRELKLNKPTGYGQTAMAGLYSDSGGFTYENKRYKQTLELIAELLDNGVNIENIKNHLERYTEDFMKALGELAANLSHSREYSYTFISDSFLSDWRKDSKDFNELHRAVGHFANGYIRNIDGRKYGFVVYPDIRGGDGCYSVSLRSVGSTKDVSLIASSLGGGGHKPAAGAKFEAADIEEAIKKVMAAIENRTQP